MMTFLWPLAFFLLPLPLLLRRWLKPAPSSPAGALKVPFFNSLIRGEGVGRPARLTSPFVVLIVTIIWLLLVTALARPAVVGPEIPLPAKGRDIMVAIDLSGSMDEKDFSIAGQVVTRLDVIKQAANDFILRREGDRLGLVLFSDRAYLQAPLTFDRSVVAHLLHQAQVGLTGQRTAIGDAIAVSIKRLKDRPKEGRVLVLMTDGANNEGTLEPLKAAEIAHSLGIRIYTIGIGGEAKQINTPFGMQTLNPAQDLDEETLQEVAAITGGHYFRAKDIQGLATIYNQIDRLEPVSGDLIPVRPQVALFYWPASMALILMFFLIVYRSVNIARYCRQTAHNL
ncbi:VWR domain protein in aerotolerance operon BatA [Vibrio sp. MACH09]|uniref:vWA domain-containing protein n=1 Tax=Vibrio sp. MACH09 TaxID=3025122 RepID=UPI00278CA9D2|nr:VWA domain-containing protein [Vibrio sp. MACH09]GLO63968.1 VWR domain protein in aerotolerance operon BatA [Vibrio sp. MACH09]